MPGDGLRSGTPVETARAEARPHPKVVQEGAPTAQASTPSAAATDPPLTAQERRAIARRLAPLLGGSGLLLLGLLHARLQPGQAALSASIQALGALTVFAPIATQAIRGFLARPSRDVSTQLVALATLAAMATGDFVTATLVPLLMEIGRLFEERSARGARAAIESLRGYYARRARVLRDGAEAEVEATEVTEGETVVVRPGEVIAVDGRVLQGRSSIDRSTLTGESTFESVAPGGAVFAGSTNLDGLLHVEATRVGDDSVLGRVVTAMRRVESSKTPLLRWLERFSGTYLPVVLFLAGTTLFFTGELNRAIALLVVACPSALFIAGPAAVVAAMTACSRRGILVKGPGFLEIVPDVRTLVFDKTGTVTEGKLSVQRVHPFGDEEPEDVLELAARCGQGSLHPVSRAIVEEASRRGWQVGRPAETSEQPGGGVRVVDGTTLLRLGRRGWLEEEGVAVELEVATEGTTVYLARDQTLLGAISLTDRPREEARAALESLRAAGVERCVLVTGDREVAARSAAVDLGFDDVAAEVLPEQKLDIVRREQQRGRRVMVVGDGANDALAMRGADVGVAMGRQAHEVTLGGADIALVRQDLRGLPWVLKTASRTRNVIVANVGIVAVVSLTMIVLASLGRISPLTGAWLHNVDAVFVLLNSSRLLHGSREP